MTTRRARYQVRQTAKRLDSPRYRVNAGDAVRRLHEVTGPDMESIDIYRTANLLIEKHGDNAVIAAAMKADAMLDKGDLDGQRVWKAIVKAIEELQRGERKERERLH